LKGEKRMKKRVMATVGLMIIQIILLVSISQVNSQPSSWIRLTTNQYGDTSPDYSPNGEEIAFMRWQSDRWTRDIWIMDADGTNQTLLAPGGVHGWPNWSPNGTKIVFSKYYHDLRTDIQIIDRNSREVSAIVENWGPNHTPRWSPDGSKILFNHEDEHIPGGLWNLYTINVVDKQIEKITDTATYHYAFPDWSPDGSKIAVMRAPAHDEPHDIFLMNADGSNEVKLADNGALPKFFPDGERILFMRDNDLYSVDIDGTNAVQLVDCPSDWQNEESTVSPDGREVAFSARPVSKNPNWNIYKAELPPVGAPPVEDTEDYVEYVNETIQDLPNEIFNETAEDVPDVMNDFSDLFNDTLENINQEDYEGAIEKLNSIKEGIYEDIMESDERQKLIDLVDDLIAYLETLI